MKVIPAGVTEARTQWFVDFFWIPQRHVNTGVTAMVFLLPSLVRRRKTAPPDRERSDRE
jgi:hypothetical protein